MIVKKVSLFIITVLLPAVLLSQDGTGTIKGSISTVNDQPIAGANIILKGTAFGTSAALSGDFELKNIPAGSYIMVISHIGYQPIDREITVDGDATLEFSFELIRSHQMPQIEVIGQRPGRFDRIPGSAAVISRQVIEQAAPVSGNEIFRKISGIHAVDEEGIGLRANIGIRGLDPDRSRTVLMMEDGIPVALAPYGEPEMYYTPAIDRMAGLEVVKGSGSILFGPQTFGGVINYLTADPPPESEADVHLRGGGGGFFIGRLAYGNTFGNKGLQLNYLHKQGDEVGLLDFGLHDVNAKLKYSPTNRSVIGIKLGAYDEQSNSSYVGLSQVMYDTGRFDYTHLAPDDVLAVRRYSASVTHDYYFNEHVSLKTTAFGYTTMRNWSRQDFDNSPREGRNYIRIVGDSNNENGAIFFRDATGNRNRQFEVLGIEPRLSVNYEISGKQNEMDAGIRYLYERAFEQRINGTTANPKTGALRDDEIRTGYAFSAYLQNRFYANEKLSITPGLRMENFAYDRNILLNNFDEKDITATDKLIEFIPGIGINYQYGNGSSLYGGVHRGFGPPRVKDAISATGQSEQLDAEKSWNYELGTRSILFSGVAIELTGFYLDFSNQIIPVSESSGGAGQPNGAGLVNGGATRHLGFETGLNLDISRLWDFAQSLHLNSTATFTRATFSEDRFVMDGSETVNVKGNQLPYAPEMLFSSNLYWAAHFGVYFNLTCTYTGSRFGDALNSVEGSADGRSGKMDAHFLLDISTGYNIPVLPGASVSLSVKNLLDERYIASRRPQGIRVGLPRFFSAGIDWKI